MSSLQARCHKRPAIYEVCGHASFQPVEEASATDSRGTKALLFAKCLTPLARLAIIFAKTFVRTARTPFQPFVERADARFVEASLHPSARDSETAHQNAEGPALVAPEFVDSDGLFIEENISNFLR